MNWYLKSKIQNMVALLPPSISYSTYYWLQRHFGRIRRANPLRAMTSGFVICSRIQKAGRSPVGGRFLEIGTGRRINMPLAFWLAGAEKVVTIDLNPYLKEELVKEDIEFIRANREEIDRSFREYIFGDRLDSLLDVTSHPWNLTDLLGHCGIEYRAPEDATRLPLPPDSIDFYISYNVFEHIPPGTLNAMIREGNRVVRKEGCFIHKIDHSDHFSHTDKSISLINFLKYGEAEWKKIAGNRFMYMNRLREDDYHDLITTAHQKIVSSESLKDSTIPELLRQRKIKLDPAFQGKSEEVLSTIESWIISEKCE